VAFCVEFILRTGYFTSDGEPDGVENAIYSTYIEKVKLDIYCVHIQLCVLNVLWVAFLVLSGSLSLVKYPVDILYEKTINI
jgi:hypothetical protein